MTINTAKEPEEEMQSLAWSMGKIRKDEINETEKNHLRTLKKIFNLPI